MPWLQIIAIYCIYFPLYRLWYPRKPLLPLMYSGLTISRTSDSYLSCSHNTLACSQGGGMVRCAIWRHCKGRERKGRFVFGTCCGLTANTVSPLLDLSLLDCQHQVPTAVGTLLQRTIWEASIPWKGCLKTGRWSVMYCDVMWCQFHEWTEQTPGTF
jgi:hypothetical protein